MGALAWVARHRIAALAAAVAVALAAVFAVPPALGAEIPLAGGILPVHGAGGTASVKPGRGIVAGDEAASAAEGGSTAVVPPEDSAKPASPPFAGSSVDMEDLAAGRQIVRTARVTLEVKDVRDAYDTVLGIVARYGGYSLDAQVSGDGGQERATLRVQVPAERLQDFLSEVQGLGHVAAAGESGSDVTEQVVDVEARLAVLRDEEARLLGFLDQAGGVADMLKVEQQLEETRTRIETLEAQRKALQTTVAMATVDVSLLPAAPVVSGGGDGGGFLGQLARVFLVALQTFAFVMSRVALAVAWLLPFAAAAAVVYGGVCLYRSRRTAG